VSAAQAFECLVFEIQSVAVHHDHAHVTYWARRMSIGRNPHNHGSLLKYGQGALSWPLAGIALGNLGDGVKHNITIVSCPPVFRPMQTNPITFLECSRPSLEIYGPINFVNGGENERSAFVSGLDGN
jgi:hypothetical protein